MPTPEDHPDASFYGCDHARYVHLRTGTFYPTQQQLEQPILCDIPPLREMPMYNLKPLHTCVNCASALAQRGLVNQHLIIGTFQGWN